MRVLVIVGLFGLAIAAPPLVPQSTYHETVGIPAYERLKAAEETTDFDGSRIVGGSAVSLGQYPHTAGLIILLTDGRQSVCGASLLTNTKLSTAAHCWYDGQHQAAQFTVVLGTVFLFQGGTRVVTRNVVMHQSWFPLLVLNDVAVITINWVNYSNTIRNINLPSGALLNNDFAHQYAYASGYGQQGAVPVIPETQQMHHVALRVIPNDRCQYWYGLGIRPSTLCTDGSERRSTCNGDSGGPLQINTANGPVLIGITSFGSVFGCQSGWPAAFARVTFFTPWIQARL